MLCLAKAADTLELRRVARALWGVVAGVAVLATATFSAALWALVDFEAAQIRDKVVPVILEAVNLPPSTTTTSAP